MGKYEREGSEDHVRMGDSTYICPWHPSWSLLTPWMTAIGARGTICRYGNRLVDHGSVNCGLRRRKQPVGAELETFRELVFSVWLEHRCPWASRALPLFVTVQATSFRGTPVII